jgi:PhzF family phenazine biosynthesis protein
MKLYQVDAFTDQVFHGNPAAVCIVEEELDSSTMQQIAMEMNLSETAFVRIYKDHCNIRWFTPATEVPLCGHATLASSFILFTEGYWPQDRVIEFDSLSGPLFVHYHQEGLTLNFPSQVPRPLSDEKVIEYSDSFDVDLAQVLEVPNEMIFIFKQEEELRTFDPQDAKVAALAQNGLIISAWSGQEGVDFISRYFAPNLGIKEDPVTGFMHTILTPYWAEQKSRTSFNAYQASKRGGHLYLALADNRVLIKGKAVKVFETELLF